MIRALPLSLAILLAACSSPRHGSADREGSSAAAASAGVETAPPAPHDEAPSRAANALGDGALTIDEALAIAAERNPDVVLARAGVGVANARVALAELWPHDPSVRVEGATDVFFHDEGEGEFSVSLAQTFETGGARGERAIAARASRRAVVLDAEAALWRARAAVAEAFYALVAAAEDKALATRRRDIAAEASAIAETRLRAADVSLVDANLVRAAGHQASAGLAAAERSRASASLRLSRLLGLGPRDDIATAGSLRALDAEAASAIADVAALEKLAVGSRREIAAAREERESLLKKADAASASRWPDVTVDLFYARETSVFELGAESESDHDDLLGLGVELPLPIFSRATGERQEALAEATRAAIEIDVLVEDVRAEVREAALRAGAARDLVALYESRLNAIAEENRALVGEAFRVGQVGAIEVLKAREEESRIEEGYLAARHEAARALVALERALGVTLGIAARSER